MTIRWCTKCVYPSVAATPLTFDENGVCSGCQVAEQRKSINWDERWDMLRKFVEPYKNKSTYDIAIPVGGGKDSYFQAHIAIKELGLKALLITYHGNNFYPEGEENLLRMREVFDCDHIIARPGTETLVKFNRVGFRLQGDNNWHNHCGIVTYPIKLAAMYKIPLMLWGEHGFMDLGGMFSYNDFIEYTAKCRVEHFLRGFDWHDFTDEGVVKNGHPEWKEGLTDKDMQCYQYPTDEEIDAVGLRGIYLSNYMHWEANDHVKLVMEKYGWKPRSKPFERTYRQFSNVDDMHENGIHDYLKYMKLGYGRGTDHSCKDIRAGLMTRDEGIEMVRKYDHVKPRYDLERWLKYVNMTEKEFDGVCDRYRDPRVWQKDSKGNWVKDNIWDQQKVPVK